MTNGKRTRVAFIRGINVGGSNKLPMADLRSILTDAGFGAPKTYIQSGNVVYEAPADAGGNATALRAEAATITGLIKQHFGFAPVVMVLTADTVARHLNASPYRAADPAQAFVVFVDGDPADLGDPTPYATNGEQFLTLDGVVHLHAPNGIGRSKLFARFAGSSKAPTTTRNLRTIEAVLALADA